MRSRRPIFAAAALAFLLGALAGGRGERRAMAQQDARPPVGRYQIAAYGFLDGFGSSRWGCFVVDTATGELWMTKNQDDRDAWGKVLDGPR